jgi:hypothetical protein
MLRLVNQLRYCKVKGQNPLRCTIEEKMEAIFFNLIFESSYKNFKMLYILQVNIFNCHIFRTINIMHFVSMCMVKQY